MLIRYALFLFSAISTSLEQKEGIIAVVVVIGIIVLMSFLSPYYKSYFIAIFIILLVEGLGIKLANQLGFLNKNNFVIVLAFLFVIGTNIVTFFMCWRDKKTALANREKPEHKMQNRVPESVLHF